MRELIYVSERKLRQFQPSKSPRGWWRRVTGVGATAPLSLGQLQLTLSEQASTQLPDLARILRHLDHSEQPPAPYDDDADPAPGTWVTFTARLNYKIVSEPRRPELPALLFWEPSPKESDVVAAYLRERNHRGWVNAQAFREIYAATEPDSEERQARVAQLRESIERTPRPEPPPRPARLLLHGSPEHLVGTPPGETPPVTQHSLPISSPCQMVEFLNNQERAQYPLAIGGLLERLDHEVPPEIASHMTGYARVTANIPLPFTYQRVLLASPLYVALGSR